MTKTRWLAASASVLVVQLMAGGMAEAQPIDTESLIERTCMEATAARPEVARRRLAAFILSDAGEIDHDPESRIVEYMNEDDVERRQVRDRVRDAVTILEQQLAEGSNSEPVELGLRASPRGTGGGWLFENNVRLFCTFAPEDAAPGGESDQRSDAERVFFNHLRLRQNPEALTLTGEARLKAGSAQIGYERERVILEDGTRRRDSTLSIEAALGYAIADEEAFSLLIYGAYELDRSRSNPAPPLAPDASASDSDTNIIEIGLTGHRLIGTDAFSALVTANGSVIFDRVKRSERLRVALSAEPTFGRFPGGICYFGAFGPPIDLGFARLRGRCTLTVLGQVNHVMDAGSAEFGVEDEFILAGGRFAFDLATSSGSGVIAGFTYEYQHAIDGAIPSIDRFTAHLKYRHWLRGRRIGIDVGFDFTDGINPESFVDENRLRFGVGLIF